MEKQQDRVDLLEAKLALMEKELAERDSIIAKSEANNIELTTSNLELNSTNLELNSTNHKLATTNLKLTSSVEYLQFQIEELRRALFGSKRERFVAPLDANQLTINFEPTVSEIEVAVAAEREKIHIEFERQKPNKKHVGRMALPSHLPVVETTIEPLEDTSNMICIGQEVTEELDYIPAILRINRTIRPKYITKEDENGDQKQVIAELNRPIPKCIASVALIGMIFINKFVYHLPYYRTLQQLSRMGVQVPSSTFESWVKLGANLIRPLYEVHRLHVFSEVYQMIDETPIKVQDSEKPGACHQGYVWVRCAPLSKSCLFEYYKSRSTKGPIDDLETMKGYIQTDGYAGYTFLAEKANITHLSCWAHARRYFDKALKNDKDRASHVMKLIQVLYSVEALARESQLSHEQRKVLRLEKSLPIINQIGTYLMTERSKVTPKSPIGVAIEYALARWNSLQNYLCDGMLEIDSNMVENSIRPLAIGRKNYLFAGSHDAAKDIAMFYSFFATCQKHDIDPQKWLTYAMNNINDTKSSQLRLLLPQFIDKNLVG